MANNDEILKQRIIDLANKSGVTMIHGWTPEMMADGFLSYTPLGRMIILDWYGGMRKTKKSKTYIEKAGFESKYFYIGGTDAAVAMLLLGYEVDNKRRANVYERDMQAKANEGMRFKRVMEEEFHSHDDRFFVRSNFFKRHQLKSKEINYSWKELY